MDNRQFYYDEWHNAERSGNKSYAVKCKDKYRELVMISILKPYHFHIEKLKHFQTIILN